ncbi:hypothetical protein IMF27_10780 [Pseudomonas sp. PCH199]|uniref:hypothetical protein n=1 Tax=unclassified Pseudomonas TaxID=196821 RepID=UPI000BC8DA01|nr:MULTISPECIES: hypothetical protein [unclassified Pseudomonas]MCW8276112.1 hypothetical protein [Pseudomonas sp. PCH199]PAM83504.1 hypothetical protein CES87_11040 [Pseudomonas sp. ERMR1:02]
MTCISRIPSLAPPTLAQANKAAINFLAATNLWVDVGPYADMDSGDLIELFWDGSFVASRVLTAQDVGHSVSLRVPESFILSGAAWVHYRVMQVGRNPALSVAARVLVKLDCPGGPLAPHSADENQLLAPVSLPATIRRRGVNPQQIQRGVPLTIEPYINMAEGDEITLRWGDVRLDLPPVKACEVGLPLRIWVPPAIITEAGEDQRLEVTYCILDRVGNNSRWAPARTLKIGFAKPAASCNQ